MNLEDVLKQLPGLNCKSCGYNSCREMAMAIIKGEKSINDCKVISSSKNIELKINGDEIYMGEFVKKIVRNTILALISSLKIPEIKEGDIIEIKLKVSKNDAIFIKYGKG